jgi:hypothetical protein
MSEKQSSSSSSGIGIAGWLFLLFTALKLCHVIDWSWWWVTAPLWGTAALVVVTLAGVVLIPLVVGVIASVWLWCARKLRKP